MKTRFLFCIFFVLILISVAPASATITLTDYNNRIDLTDERITISDLYDYVVAHKGESATHELYLEEISPGVWNVSAQIFSGSATDKNGTLVISSDDGTRVNFSYVAGSGYYGYWAGADWSDITIGSDFPTANTRMLFANESSFDNVSFDYAGQTLFGNNYYPRVDIEVNDCTQTGWNTYTEFYGDNFTIDGFRMVGPYPVWDTTRAGIKDSYLNNSTVKNILVESDGKLVAESTDSYGIQIIGYYNDYENLRVVNSSYSGYNLQGEYNSYVNLSVHNASHNQVEAQGQNDYYENITVTGGTSADTDSAWFTSLADGGSNITVNGMYLDSGGSSSVRILGETDWVTNYTIKNATILDGRITLGGIKDSIFENINQSIPDRDYIQVSNEALARYPYNITFVNSSLHGSSVPYFILINSNVKFVNTDYDNTQAGSLNYTLIDYYPLNVWVHNESNISLKGALITLESDVNPVNYYGINTTTALTDANGNISVADMLYIAERVRTPSGTVEYTTNATASYGGADSSIYNIDPGTSWRSFDIISLDNPLQTFSLDVVVDEPEPETPSPLSFTSTSPDKNVSSYIGDTQTFRVEVNKTAGTLWWYWNGTYQDGTDNLNFSQRTRTATVEGLQNITAVVSEGNDTISYTWNWNISAVPSWTPTTCKHYIGVPEVNTWTAGSFVTTFTGTYTEAQTEITGVEIIP